MVHDNLHHNVIQYNSKMQYNSKKYAARLNLLLF